MPGSIVAAVWRETTLVRRDRVPYAWVVPTESSRIVGNYLFPAALVAETLGWERYAVFVKLLGSYAALVVDDEGGTLDCFKRLTGEYTAGLALHRVVSVVKLSSDGVVRLRSLARRVAKKTVTETAGVGEIAAMAGSPGVSVLSSPKHSVLIARSAAGGFSAITGAGKSAFALSEVELGEILYEWTQDEDMVAAAAVVAAEAGAG